MECAARDISSALDPDISLRGSFLPPSQFLDLAFTTPKVSTYKLNSRRSSCWSSEPEQHSSLSLHDHLAPPNHQSRSTTFEGPPTMHYSPFRNTFRPPQVALIQCIVGTYLSMFFFNHGWYYDHFDCMNLFKASMASRSREAFKRIMVLLYVLGCPAYAIQGALYAWIKYQEGFLPLNKSGMPVPFTMWPERFQRLVMPLQYLNAFAWTCELIVHLEEVMFFLHLVALKPSSTPWFQSWYFRELFTFASLASIEECRSHSTQSFVLAPGSVLIGALVAGAAMFGPCAYYNNDPLRGEAVLVLAGSSFILISNFVFFKVFAAFPAMLENLKGAGGTSEVVIRLKSFHEINKIRVGARFCFGIPLFALAIDGLLDNSYLNTSLFWTDFLLLFGLIGFGIQATCTLLIFMPRVGGVYDLSSSVKLSMSSEPNLLFAQNIAREAGVTRPTVSQDRGGGMNSIPGTSYHDNPSPGYSEFKSPPPFSSPNYSFPPTPKAASSIKSANYSRPFNGPSLTIVPTPVGNQNLNSNLTTLTNRNQPRRPLRPSAVILGPLSNNSPTPTNAKDTYIHITPPSEQGSFPDPDNPGPLDLADLDGLGDDFEIGELEGEDDELDLGLEKKVAESKSLHLGVSVTREVTTTMSLSSPPQESPLMNHAVSSFGIGVEEEISFVPSSPLAMPEGEFPFPSTRARKDSLPSSSNNNSNRHRSQSTSTQSIMSGRRPSTTPLLPAPPTSFRIPSPSSGSSGGGSPFNWGSGAGRNGTFGFGRRERERERERREEGNYGAAPRQGGGPGGRRPSIPLALRKFNSPIDIV
ncbi:hypothetical protein T439DRAFT_382206 [Meredithblackwellia eburnea MCA 4105]